ncbi:MAG: thiamine-phosphate pyrophosphorylase [Candidatus Omnitrophica bacterium]|nr:thiamine-phosphate pyrophosphorylase [Candidatus Omnitrophota bacterium]MDD5655320.1 thiamine-phosphate pyrophosphorylase [Candidatus Omnitrophota bacterium]
MAKRNYNLKGVYRILDANFNRASEGLRVCEEVSRFILNDRALSGSLKNIRHKINKELKGFFAPGSSLLEARNSGGDVGKTLYAKEMERNDPRDIFFANIQRVKESIRVLEEFSKLVSIKSALDLKKIRYDIYGIEKSIAEKMRALRHSR